MVSVILPYCSKLANKRIEQQITIIDLKGFNVSPILFNSAVRAYVQMSSTIAQDFYPELLGQMIIVNAPFLFNMLWTIIKVWLDKKTKKKIQIYGSGYKKDLLKLIDADQLPDFLGGNLIGHPQVRSLWTDYQKFCSENKKFYFDEKFQVSDPLEVAMVNPMDRLELKAYLENPNVIGGDVGVDDQTVGSGFYDVDEDVQVSSTSNQSLI